MRVLSRLAAATAASDAIALALEETPAVSAADAVGVYLFRDGRVDVHSRGVSDRAVSRYLALPAGSDPLLAHMCETGGPVHERMLFSPAGWRAHPLYESAAGPFGFEHYLVAPLIGRGELVGALTLARGPRTPVFTGLDRMAVAMTASYLSVALAYTARCETSVVVSLSRLTRRERQISVFLTGIYGVFTGTGAVGHAHRVTAALGDIWHRVAPDCPPAWRQRLVRHVENYIDACVWEAQNRHLGRVPSRAVFQVMRMFTSTMYEFWDFIEYAGNAFLPDHVVEHPVIAELRRAANAVASYANDIFSLRKEIENRDFHNLVVVVQHEEGLELPAAARRAAALHDEQVHHYCALERLAPQFGPELDPAVARYLEGMRIWMRANHDWSMITPRYHPDHA